MKRRPVLNRWYIPSWNGDLRLETDQDDPAKTVLTIVDPTDDEERMLGVIGNLLLEAGLVEEWSNKKRGYFSRLDSKMERRVINAPITQIGPLIVQTMRPGPAVLTAITFKGGQCLTTSGDSEDLTTMAAALAPAEKPATEPAPAPLTEKPAPKIEPAAAATVRRPTPSCPQCEVGAIQPASEVLLSFLTPEEHRTWAAGRFLIVEGGLSGHRYLLAHRSSPLAARIGRICFDLDTRCVVHFHDRRVPPEEEVLAAKLILQYREPWLRNEATVFHPSALRFKNPFGDGSDGIVDADFTQRIGREAVREFALDLFRTGAGAFIG